MRINLIPRTRLFVVALFAAAATLGATDAVPGGAWVASLFGVVQLDAQDPIRPEECANMNCLGAADCKYMQSHQCQLGNSQCTVKNCVG